ncbi:hypothetical protein HK104_001131 [Borealophlyctis nickersoniae]|nr:hypothetical protein HK104_001131 [Borealophlyctis nickersoniae]
MSTAPPTTPFRPAPAQERWQPFALDPNLLVTLNPADRERVLGRIRDIGGGCEVQTTVDTLGYKVYFVALRRSDVDNAKRRIDALQMYVRHCMEGKFREEYETWVRRKIDEDPGSSGRFVFGEDPGSSGQFVFGSFARSEESGSEEGDYYDAEDMESSDMEISDGEHAENEENKPTREQMVSAAANKWRTFANEQHPALRNDRIGTGQLHRHGANYIPVTEQAAIRSVQTYYVKEKREKERKDAGETDDRRHRPARRPQGLRGGRGGGRSGARSRPTRPPPQRRNVPFVMPGPVSTWKGNQAIPGGENFLGVPIEIANHLPFSAPTHAPPRPAANLPPPSSTPANRNPQMPAHPPPRAPLNLPPPSFTFGAANRQPQMTDSQRKAAKPPASTAFVLPGPLVSWNNSKPTPATESLAGIPVSQPPKQPSAASTAPATAKTSSLPPKGPAPAPPKSAAPPTRAPPTPAPPPTHAPAKPAAQTQLPPRYPVDSKVQKPDEGGWTDLSSERAVAPNQSALATNDQKSEPGQYNIVGAARRASGDLGFRIRGAAQRIMEMSGFLPSDAKSAPEKAAAPAPRAAFDPNAWNAGPKKTAESKVAPVAQPTAPDAKAKPPQANGAADMPQKPAPEVKFDPDAWNAGPKKAAESKVVPAPVTTPRVPPASLTEPKPKLKVDPTAWNAIIKKRPIFDALKEVEFTTTEVAPDAHKEEKTNDSHLDSPDDSDLDDNWGGVSVIQLSSSTASLKQQDRGREAAPAVSNPPVPQSSKPTLAASASSQPAPTALPAPAESAAKQPSVAPSPVTQPSVRRPSVTQPAVGQPPVTQPSVSSVSHAPTRTAEEEAARNKLKIDKSRAEADVVASPTSLLAAPPESEKPVHPAVAAAVAASRAVDALASGQESKPVRAGVAAAAAATQQASTKKYVESQPGVHPAVAAAVAADRAHDSDAYRAGYAGTSNPWGGYYDQFQGGGAVAGGGAAAPSHPDAIGMYPGRPQQAASYAEFQTQWYGGYSQPPYGYPTPAPPPAAAATATETRSPPPVPNFAPPPGFGWQHLPSKKVYPRMPKNVTVSLTLTDGRTKGLALKAGDDIGEKSEAFCKQWSVPMAADTLADLLVQKLKI